MKWRYFRAGLSVVSSWLSFRVVMIRVRIFVVLLSRVSNTAAEPVEGSRPLVDSSSGSYLLSLRFFAQSLPV